MAWGRRLSVWFEKVEAVLIFIWTCEVVYLLYRGLTRVLEGLASHWMNWTMIILSSKRCICQMLFVHHIILIQIFSHSLHLLTAILRRILLLLPTLPWLSRTVRLSALRICHKFCLTVVFGIKVFIPKRDINYFVDSFWRLISWEEDGVYV